MDLKQLSYFTAVVEEGTISAAARRLHLTQPPLSAQMKALEEEAGCVLFERGSRQIRLTAAGQMLYGRAQKMLELADITVRELQDYQEGTGGVLRLGVVSSIGSSFLTGAVRSFCTEHPQINFELTEGNTYQLLDKLSSGLIELAIVRTPFSGQGLSSVLLLEEPLLAAGRQQYFPAKDSLTLADLKDTPLILYRRWEPILSESFRNAGFLPRIFCKNDDARTSAAWADAGLGVTILPA
ncbi:MAG: LysR family transcriptional regulator, partial [Lachnospiraceae bacterium]|nr:LysR family transcriptional regulator [Lachnospiraceae bacterium]